MSHKRTGRPVGTTGKARAITDDELLTVIDYARTTRHPERNVLMIILSNYLGLRAKELASLKIKDVFDGTVNVKTLRVLAGYSKGNKHRDISMENTKVQTAVSEYICARKISDGELFNLQAPLFKTQIGGKFTANSIAHRFIEIYSAAGLEKASSHTGRRSLITKLAYKGVDINSIRQIAGHSSIIVTQTYIDDNPFRIKEILSSI